MIDCLIAAVAIAADAEVLHADADFAELAVHTPLKVRHLSR
jgi:predicted nucleic acid-binding protein